MYGLSNGSNGSDLEGHSPVAGRFKCNLSNIFAAIYTILTDGVLARFLCISRASCRNIGIQSHIGNFANVRYISAAATASVR